MAKTKCRYRLLPCKHEYSTFKSIYHYFVLPSRIFLINFLYENNTLLIIIRHKQTVKRSQKVLFSQKRNLIEIFER